MLVSTITDADIYRSAGKLLKQHGQDAVIVATLRAAELLSQGNMNGYRMWKWIICVVDEFISVETPNDAIPH